MLINLNADMTPIRFVAPKMTSERIAEFNQAVGARFCQSGAAPTYATTFRKAEFDFLDRLQVNLRNLLHTDQEYEYVSAFCVGDEPEVETQFFSSKERRGMVFVSMKTQVLVKGQLRVNCLSSFVLRENPKG